MVRHRIHGYAKPAHAKMIQSYAEPDFGKSQDTGLCRACPNGKAQNSWYVKPVHCTLQDTGLWKDCLSKVRYTIHGFMQSLSLSIARPSTAAVVE